MTVIFQQAVFIKYTAGFLERKAAKGSDSGFCMAQNSGQLDKEKLIAFGYRAKSEILCKSEAYTIADKTGIHLSEHGGTGAGVIGAVAGVGLRLTGNDGRYRGWYHFGRPGDIVSVKTICECNFVDQVITKDGSILGPAENLSIGSKKIKTVRRSGNRVVLAHTYENLDRKSHIRYRTLTKDEIRAY